MDIVANRVCVADEDFNAGVVFQVTDLNVLVPYISRSESAVGELDKAVNTACGVVEGFNARTRFKVPDLNGAVP